ncbi:polycystin 2 [Mytilus galloprovincialis]|uniref:Polycystin 2 n=1 Tax=Mytilus galloprovincialis TaxID=29158 RepID=A0A8B6GC85_MYTGA|nr:polycystin 2 [Mytilus galloprovincialis]
MTSNTDLYINWDGFHDVEEYETGPHATGIKEYILGIGTTPGGNDVYSFENVGVVQHKALHGLSLQNGYVYYATLKAVDFAKRETEKISAPITIDVTPPDRTDNPITLINRHITSTSEISPCWKEVFMDVQSGLDYYLWSVGSQPGYTDMMTYIKTTDECGITDKNNPLSLLDGHSYYINVRAFNKAGLSSVATSWAFELDTTPPTPGHVYDGDKDLVTGSIKDIDYQIKTKVLHAHWEGFHESHSTIKDYYVSIGTCPQCEDILGQQAIGIAYEFTLENTHLGTGLRYYTTVTACNTAEMCTTVTSDGVIIDNSPPTPGTVQDGTGYYDTEYQSLKNYISAKWYGFDDAQSGLEKYEWRVGTKPGNGDIIPTIELHLTETAALLDSSSYNLSLPINTRMYITVRAYNKAGLWSESSSSGFSVDDTPPVLSKVTTFSNDFGITDLTQIYRTTMKVEWEVEDTESFIKRQYLSIKSHIGGEFMLSSQPVNGIARSYVFTGLDLHDGVTYYVTLITCNSADICISDTSQGMFVDSTPPSRGMFAVSTDHASDPDTSRNEHGWMTFGSNAVYLAWLGFSDIHSQIDHYMVTVGTSYMEKNLNKDLKTKYVHVDSNTDHGDEGKVQLFKIDTVVLTQYEEVYITMWAVNKVGLRSQMIHSAFKKTPPSYLDLVRRCDAISCEGHCVCSPQDRKCPYNPSLGNCTDVSDGVFSGTQYTLLLVKDTNGYTTDDQAVTASDSVLRASWIISQQFPSKPLWYEWSVGYEDEATPIGIYDSVKQKVWHDAGQLMDTIFTVGPDQELLENNIKYSVFVRIWYTSDTYAVFKTDGIAVMTQMPALATVRGTAVIEKVLNTNVKDADYMRIGRPITFLWKDKFLNAAATIKEYKLYISSFPGGYDIMTIPTSLDGTAEGFNMSRVNLSPGIKYYSNVIAYNYAGVHTTSTSDGFIVDHIDPSAGIVYDGLGGQDVEYKNSSDIVEAHWHGFIDTESGIQSYRWMYLFQCDKWLSIDFDDGMIERIIPVSITDDIGVESLFYQQSRMNLTENHLWMSLFVRPTRSVFTRVQRLACGITLLLLTMISNAMFFKSADEETMQADSVKLGFFRLSMTNLFISFIGIIITTPPIFFATFVFRNTEPKAQPLHFQKKTKQRKCLPCLKQKESDAEKLKEIESGLSEDDDFLIYKKRRFPYYVAYIAWIVLVLGSSMSAFFLLLYSMEWGKNKSEEWLSTFILSFFESILFVDPIKVILIAFLIALIFKKHVDDETTLVDMKKLRTAASKHSAGNSRLFWAFRHEVLSKAEPPAEEKLNKQREIIKLQTRAKSVFREVILYTVFAIIVYCISYLNRDDRAYIMKLNIDNHIYESSKVQFGFSKVNSMDTLMQWMDKTFVPAFYPVQEYNGASLSLQDKFYISDLTNIRLGLVRFRQVRMPKEKCGYWKLTPNHFCTTDFQSSREEKRQHCVSWKPRNSTCPAAENSFLTKDAYRYRSAEELHSMPFAGGYDVYGGGGYIQDFPNNRDSVNTILNEIKTHRWMDRRTRALLIEFSLYNSNIKLITFSTFAVEFTDTGNVLAYTFTQSFRPTLLTDATGAFSILFYFIYIIALIIATVKIIGKFRDQGCDFFKAAWNVIDLITVVLSYVAIAVWIVKYIQTSRALKRIVGIIVFTATLRILKALGYNKRCAELVTVVKHAAPQLFSFFVVFGLGFFGFVILGHLLFGSSMFDYHNMLTASGSLANTLIGRNSLDKMVAAAPSFAQVYFFVYVLFIIFILLTMFAAILNQSITEVRANYQNESPIGILDLIKGAFTDLLGLVGIHLRSNKRQNSVQKSKS